MGAKADEYPSRPIKFITSGGPGGASDILARVIADGLKDQLGQAVVVENRTGGMNMIAFRALMSAPADGYTILLGAPEMTVLPLVAKSVSEFDPLRDMAPVARAVNTWGVLASSPKSGLKTLKDLISHAKSHPGAVRVGLNQQALTLRFPVELLQMEAGIKLTPILYKTTRQALTDTINGEIQMSSMSLTTAQLNQEQVNLLAQTGPDKRHRLLPNVPTMAELGMPEVSVDIWWGVMAPLKTPQSIISRLASAIERALTVGDMDDRIVKLGMEPSFLPPSEFAKYIAADQQKYRKLIPQWGIKIEG
jgi:tripartite-type tricarboxylate transporter receptor subunit TctC